MTDSNRPHVGIVSDAPLQRQALQSALTGYGLNIAVICDPNILSHQLPERTEKVECWILEVADENNHNDALDALIEETDKPLLFGVGKAPKKEDEQYISWERRLLSKLEEHLGKVELMDSEESIIALDQPSNHHLPTNPTPAPIRPAHRSVSKDIWVLAASLGGPAAVKEFLDEIPATIKAGFLYAQHIDAHFSKVLTNVLGRHSQLDLKAIEAGDILHDGDVLVVPVDREITFSPEGINVNNNEWSGPYGPSIDHLLSNVLSHYGANCHVIVFSGMGNDGAMTASEMKRQGCQIWTQTPDSCANGSMPQSIIDLHCNQRVGTPKELARAFVAHVGCYSDTQAPNHDQNDPDLNVKLN